MRMLRDGELDGWGSTVVSDSAVVEKVPNLIVISD